MILPQSIQIQTIDYCNRKCVWCPNSKMTKKPNALMIESLFDKILEDLKSVNYKGAFHPYLMGEPLCDPRIYGFIRKIRDMFPFNEIMISTNGDYLKTEDDIQRLLDAGLTWMAVSHYDNSNDWLLELQDKYPNIIHTTIGQLRHTYYNRAGHIDVECITPLKKCDWVFNKAYINYKGDMILCCSDYDYKVVFGNLKKQSFVDVYNSERYNDYRRFHSTGLGKIMELCYICNRIR